MGENMKSIKLRIKSVTSTRQITKAMELVATSKLRRAQERVLRSRPYYGTLYGTLQDIVTAAEEFSSPYIEPREIGSAVFLVIAGDRGLAGGYNSNVLRMAEELIRADREAGVRVRVLPIGRKALEYFSRRGYEIYTEAYAHAELLQISGCFTIAKDLCREYLSRGCDRLTVCYTMFNSMLSQSPLSVEVLPLVVDRSVKRHTGQLYDMDAEAVFSAIVPEYVGGILYGALCESLVSEQGARRTAMDAATKNADEMIGDLSLRYNRARQGAITQEITEIVAGAEA